MVAINYKILKKCKPLIVLISEDELGKLTYDFRKETIFSIPKDSISIFESSLLGSTLGRRYKQSEYKKIEIIDFR